MPPPTIGIPVGDLFVAMESWEEPEAIKASMDVILEIGEGGWGRWGQFVCSVTSFRPTV